MEFKDLNDKQQVADLILSAAESHRISCNVVERILIEMKDLEKKLTEANKRRKEDLENYKRLTSRLIRL